MAMSSGKVNATELTAALINRCDNLIDGIHHAQEVIDGSCTILLLTSEGLNAARDKLGRLPVVVGKSETGCCVSLESFACQKLGYQPCYYLGSGEIVKITAKGYEQLAAPGDKMKICAFLWSYYGYPNSNYEGQNVEVVRCRNGEITKITADGYEQLAAPGDKMKICAFLWTYYGYPNSNYEGMNVEVMRYRNGEIMAREEEKAGALPDVDYVAGVPDSGLPHAIGYANYSHKPFARPFV